MAVNFNQLPSATRDLIAAQHPEIIAEDVKAKRRAKLAKIHERYDPKMRAIAKRLQRAEEALRRAQFAGNYDRIDLIVSLFTGTRPRRQTRAADAAERALERIQDQIAEMQQRFDDDVRRTAL